jgi:catechol 2,3-dioxygenase-like lactoylglutathione lyase family enzyme
MAMRVRYVVLYVTDVEVCRRFWVEQLGMVEKSRTEVGELSVVQVGFADQEFAFELVPLALMADNPDGLDLATPSIALHVDDLEAARAQLLEHGVPVSEIADHGGVRSFGFSDPEDHWFAITS